MSTRCLKLLLICIGRAEKNQNDDFRKSILNEFQGKQHRDLIVWCATKQKDITKNISLMLMLIGKLIIQT